MSSGDYCFVADEQDSKDGGGGPRKLAGRKVRVAKNMLATASNLFVTKSCAQTT